MDEVPDQRISAFLTELRTLLQKSNENFERQLNYLGAGSIGVSILIVEKLFEDISQTEATWLIVTAWVFFGLTLISNLISHVYTFEVHYRTIQEIESDSYQEQKAKCRNTILKCWNWISVSFLVVGIISFVTYISINI